MATKRVRNNGLHIPVELVEKILLNLPVKSLLRFSAVSKSWNRMILGSEFARRYRGREMMVLRVAGDEKALVCPLSSLSIENATPFLLPFTAEQYTDVSCGELRCVEFENSLCLYNPSTRRYRKLPTPSCAPEIGCHVTDFPMPVSAYGLGYDSTANDYKVVKILRNLKQNCEVYSLKSDCWRELSNSRRESLSCMPGNGNVGRTALTPTGVFADGALYWLVYNMWLSEDEGVRLKNNIAILSFDVSTEKFREVAAPQSLNLHPDVCVLRGRLCVCVTDGCRFVVWEYNNNTNNSEGGEYYWRKDLEFDFTHLYPLCYAGRLHPLYHYDNDGNLIRAVTCCTDIEKMYIYKLDEDGHSSLVESKFGGGYGILGSSTYVESLVSPFPLFPSLEGRERGRTVASEGYLMVMDMWAPWRGKYPEPTSREFDLIYPFLHNDDYVVRENKGGVRFKTSLGCPNSRSRIIKFFVEKVRESKGYDVDEDIDLSDHYTIFIRRSLDDEKHYNEAMAATKFAIGEINAHMALMKHAKRYELESVDKLVTTRTNRLILTRTNRLLLTFSAKEIATQDLITFQAMLCYAKTPASTWKLKEWKFKPASIHKI